MEIDLQKKGKTEGGREGIRDGGSQREGGREMGEKERKGRREREGDREREREGKKEASKGPSAVWKLCSFSCCFENTRQEVWKDG